MRLSPERAGSVAGALSAAPVGVRESSSKGCRSDSGGRAVAGAIATIGARRVRAAAAVPTKRSDLMMDPFRAGGDTPTSSGHADVLRHHGRDSKRKTEARGAEKPPDTLPLRAPSADSLRGARPRLCPLS